MKKKNEKYIYLTFNILTLTLFFILFFIPLLLAGNGIVKYYIGIACRIIFGIWCIFNGLWNSCTNYYSILRNKSKNAPKWAWWIVFILGIGCLITAFMGYGFNNVEKPI